MTYILSLQDSNQVFLVCPVEINVSFTIIMQRKGSVKSLPCNGVLLPFYELMKLRVFEKQTFKWP